MISHFPALQFTDNIPNISEGRLQHALVDNGGR